MKQYSEYEIDTLINDLTTAAEEAIEQAAAEAAKAAALASLERESRAIAESHQWRGKYETARKAGVKNAVITGVICFFVGAALSGGVIAIYGGR
ncbi:ABC transporter permease [Treponema primitia]|uniref:ABC transporter permease n=1 Tax=Treponema primitia TaxID=88058 RepID=UPI0039800329